MVEKSDQLIKMDITIHEMLPLMYLTSSASQYDVLRGGQHYFGHFPV